VSEQLLTALQNKPKTYRAWIETASRASTRSHGEWVAGLLSWGEGASAGKWAVQGPIDRLLLSGGRDDAAPLLWALQYNRVTANFEVGATLAEDMHRRADRIVTSLSEVALRAAYGDFLRDERNEAKAAKSQFEKAQRILVNPTTRTKAETEGLSSEYRYWLAHVLDDGLDLPEEALKELQVAGKEPMNDELAEQIVKLTIRAANTEGSKKIQDGISILHRLKADAESTKLLSKHLDKLGTELSKRERRRTVFQPLLN
jgi:hypothetical protein